MKRIFSVFLCLIMLFSLFPVSALATEDVSVDDPVDIEEIETEESDTELMLPDDTMQDEGSYEEALPEPAPNDDPSLYIDGIGEPDPEPDNPVPEEQLSFDPEAQNPVTDEPLSFEPEPENPVPEEQPSLNPEAQYPVLDVPSSDDSEQEDPGSDEPLISDPDLNDEELQTPDTDSVTIDIMEDTVSLDAWDTWALAVNLNPDSVFWTSSDPDIASVDDYGLVTALHRGETVITASAELPGGELTSDTCIVTVLSDAILALNPEQLESDHPYMPGENAIWQYTLFGADEILLTFDVMTQLGNSGFLILADGAGDAFLDEWGNPLSFAGTQLAGQSLRLPGDTFRLYLYSDPDGTPGWGFRVSDVSVYTEPTELTEPSDQDEPEEGPDTSETNEQPESPEPDSSDQTDENIQNAVPLITARTKDQSLPLAQSFGPARIPDANGINTSSYIAAPVLTAPADQSDQTDNADQSEGKDQADGKDQTGDKDQKAQETSADDPDSAEKTADDSGAKRGDSDSLRSAPPTATITLDRNILMLDAMSEETLTATVTVPAETDLNGLSLSWSTDSDLIRVDEKNLETTADGKLTGTATVTAGQTRADTPLTVTVKVMYTADGSAEPTEVMSTADNTRPAEAACSVTVMNDAHEVSDWRQLESAHPYPAGVNSFWQYTDPDPTVRSMTLTFDTLTETVSPRDIIRITDGSGRPVGVYTGKLLAGQSVTVDSRVVRIYLDSDPSSSGAWGFKVTNLTTVTTDAAPRYSVRYYANGGVNAPKDQPAQELPLTLSEDTPTRDHYDFKGWATDRDSGATYQPGEEIKTLDSNTLVGSRLDLFAVWERIPTYNEANRGATTSSYSGPVDNGGAVTQTSSSNPIVVNRPETQYDKEVLHIRTVDDLVAFAENCSLDTWSDRLPVVLDNDLSLSGVDFWAVPIFNGCFDGRDHTIYDVNLTDAMAPCGFFLELGINAVVKNLNISGAVTPSGDNNITGGLVGVNRGMLLNCSFSGAVTGAIETGGIAGRNEAAGIISGCRSNATISGMNATGGIAGHNLGAIIACTSDSFVNIDSVDPSLNIQTLDTSSILNFIESLSSDTVGVTTDTGGITGYNEGFVETSISRGTVGYQHLGYNVGGIVGRSDGYINTCLNEADVYGRRDVGGILGQAEPYIELRESNSILAGLSYRVYALHQSIEAAANDAEVLGSDISGQLHNLSSYVNPLESALLQFDIDNPSLDAIEIIREALRNMVSGVTGELQSMGDSVDEGSTVLSEDLRAINDNINALSGTAIQSAQLISSSTGKTVLEDISVSEAESELTLGKTTGCTNRGEIRGDNNVGGIVGCMSIESTIDPESDLTSTDFLTRKQNRFRIVVTECLSDGPVTAKKECAGGIAGRADIGYIARSVAYNSIGIEDGAYAGGIAGLCYGTVGSSVAKCSLWGGKYVGGIVGNGHVPSNKDDNPSMVANCYTLVDIHDRPQFSGAVSGGGEGTYTENYFVPSGYAGLNRLSIQGQAEPVLFSVFSSLNALPEESKHFTLRFVVEGETVKEMPFEYGASFGRSVFPQVPMKDGAYAVWDRTELNDLRFDTVVTAEYRRSETALKSDLQREDGRAVGYVIGQFQQGDTLEIELIPVEEGDIDNFHPNWRQTAMEQLRSIFGGNPDYSIPISVIEHAVFRFPDDGGDLHTLRYLSPDGETENIRVYQKSNGQWQRLEPEVFGSYLGVLSIEEMPELCLVETMQSWWVLLWIAAAIAVLVLLFAIGHQLRKLHKARAAKPRNLEKQGRLRRKLHDHRKLLIILLVLLLLTALGLVAVLQSDRLQAVMTSYRSIHDFYNRESDVDTEIMIVSGDESFSLDSTVHRLAYKDNMISCADQYGIPLYITDGDIYLENGRAFRILNNSLDRGTFLRIALEAFRSGSTSVERDGGTLRCSAELDSDSISQTLRTLLSDEIEGILEVDRLYIEVAAQDGQLSEFKFNSNGRLVDGKDFDIDVTLCPQPLTERPRIPQAVLDAIDAGGRGTELLTDDFLALLAAWIRYDRSANAEATISVNADAGLLSLDNQYGYFRQKVDGTDIHAVSSRLFTVYFTDSAACTADGTSLGNAEISLKDAAALITVAREFCLNGSFRSEMIGGARVFTLSIPADNVKTILRQVLPDLSALDISYEDCVLTVTIRDDTLYSVELRCGGTLKVVVRDLDASANVIVRFVEPTAHTIPQKVKDTLLSADSEAA